MAHKTFISYKYSEAQNTRDRIIQSLGEDARFYKGETSESPDLSDQNTESIRHTLKDMIYDTSVMIVIISPNMRNSKWIDWEIEYALKNIKHGDRSSHSNGIVGVIMNNPNTDWFSFQSNESDGHVVKSYQTNYVFDIIKKNRANQTPTVYTCDKCQSINSHTGSYISFVTEDEFLDNSDFYINNAFEKSQNLENYDISKLKNV